MAQIIDLKTGNQVGVSNDSEALSASAGYSFDLTLSACHGIDVGLGAEVNTQAGLSAELAEYIELLIQAEAGASVKLEAAAVLSPRIDENFGLTLSAQALVQAYVKFIVQLGLRADRLLDTAARERDQGDLPVVLYRLFEAFVEDTVLAAGVEGKAEVALAAKGIISCRGNLLDKNPGFDVSVSGEAAFVYGMGMDFFLKARFPDQGTYLQRAVDILVDDATGRLPATPDRPWFNALMRLCFRAGFLAMLLPLKRVKGKDKLLEGLNQEFQGIIMQMLLTELTLLLESLLPDPIIANSAEDKAKIEAIVRLVSAIHTANDLPSSLTAAWQGCDVLEELGQPGHESLRELIAMVWVIGYLIDEFEKRESSFKSAPGWLQSYYGTLTGARLSTQLSRKKAALLLEHIPAMQGLIENNDILSSLDAAAQQQGTTLSALLVDFLQSNATQRKAWVEEYLLSLMAGLIKAHLLPVAASAIKDSMDHHPLTEALYKEVIAPGLEDLPHFLPLLAETLQQPPNKTDLATLEYLAQRFFLRLLGRSVALTTRYVIDYAVELTNDTLANFNRTVRQPEYRQMLYDFVDGIDDKLTDMFGPLDLLLTESGKQEIARATQHMLGQTSDAARRAIGRPNWTPARVAQLTQHLGNLLSNPDGNHLKIAGETLVSLAEEINKMKDCGFRAQSGDVEALGKQLLALSMRQFKIMLIEMPAHLLEYALKLAKILLLDPFIELVKAAAEWLEDRYEDLKAIVDDLGERMVELQKRVSDALDAIEDQIDDLAAALDRYLDDFCDQLISWVNNGKVSNLLLSGLDFISFDIFDLDGDKQAKEVINDRRAALKQQARNWLNSLKTDASALLLLSNDWAFDDQLKLAVADAYNDLNKALDFEDNLSVGTAFSQKVSDGVLNNPKIDTLTEEVFSVGQLIGARNAIQETFDIQYEKLRLAEERLQNSRLNGPAPQIKIIAPLRIEIEDAERQAGAKEQTPIYGSQLYLQIELRHVDVDRMLAEQIKGKDPSAAMEYPQRIKVLLNGREVDPASFIRSKEGFLEGFVDRTWLKQGQNHLFAVLAGPERQRSSMDYVSFFCDLKKRPPFSSDLCIDRSLSQVDAPGNDHGAAAAAPTALEKREYLVITTRTKQGYDLEGYTLMDLAGHRFKFDRTKLVKDKPVTVVVGAFEGGGNVQAWLPPKSSKNKAILNNRGEGILFRDPKGYLVDQAFFGKPENNRNFKQQKLKSKGS